MLLVTISQKMSTMQNTQQPIHVPLVATQNINHQQKNKTNTNNTNNSSNRNKTSSVDSDTVDASLLCCVYLFDSNNTTSNGCCDCGNCDCKYDCDCDCDCDD